MSPIKSCSPPYETRTSYEPRENDSAAQHLYYPLPGSLTGWVAEHKRSLRVPRLIPDAWPVVWTLAMQLGMTPTAVKISRGNLSLFVHCTLRRVGRRTFDCPESASGEWGLGASEAEPLTSVRSRPWPRGASTGRGVPPPKGEQETTARSGWAGLVP